MDTDRLNKWLTLGANVGVLIGIGLLVVELKMNRDMIRAQTRNDIAQKALSVLNLTATKIASRPPAPSRAGEQWINIYFGERSTSLAATPP